MISTVSRMARTMLPAFEPVFTRTARLPFRAPILPTVARSMSQRMVNHLQTRNMGNWPIILESRAKTKPECSADSVFVLRNHNFSIEKDTLMQTNLDLFRSQSFKQLRLERGALIGSSEWLHELLTHISESGSKTLEITALANSFKFPKVVEWVNPSISTVQKEGICLKGMDNRPEILRMRQVRLTKGMIDALTEILTSSSHGVAFEINIRG